MAKRYANYYKHGSYNVQCQRTGFKVKASDTKREWNNLIVRRASWERRHPQDFLRAIKDEPGVRFARPRATDILTNSPNLLQDPNGSTVMEDYWLDEGTSTIAVNSDGGWTVTALTATTLQMNPDRKFDIRIAGAGLSDKEDDTYTFSGSFTATSPTSGTVTLQVQWIAEDKTVSSTSSNTATAITGLTSETRLSGTFTVPADIQFIRPQIVHGVALTGTSLAIEKLKLEVGSLTSYGEKVTASTF